MTSQRASDGSGAFPDISNARAHAGNHYVLLSPPNPRGRDSSDGVECSFSA